MLPFQLSEHDGCDSKPPGREQATSEPIQALSTIQGQTAAQIARWRDKKRGHGNRRAWAAGVALALIAGSGDHSIVGKLGEYGSKHGQQPIVEIPVYAQTTSSIIDEYVTCPTRKEKDMIERDFNIRFYNTPGSTTSWSSFPYRCDSTTFTSTDPTRIKTYNVIRFLKNIQFSRPLPFTQGESLYEFLVPQKASNHTHPKLRVEPLLECDTDSSGGLFSLTLSGSFARWYPVLSKSSTCQHVLGHPSKMLVNNFVYHPLYAAELFVHETYHAIVESPHTGVDGGDATIQKMGAWAAQFYFDAWIALYSTNLDNTAKQLALDGAVSILRIRFSENRCPNDRTLKEVVNQIVPKTCP